MGNEASVPEGREAGTTPEEIAAAADALSGVSPEKQKQMQKQKQRRMQQQPQQQQQQQLPLPAAAAAAAATAATSTAAAKAQQMQLQMKQRVSKGLGTAKTSLGTAKTSLGTAKTMLATRTGFGGTQQQQLQQQQQRHHRHRQQQHLPHPLAADGDAKAPPRRSPSNLLPGSGGRGAVVDVMYQTETQGQGGSGNSSGGSSSGGGGGGGGHQQYAQQHSAAPGMSLPISSVPTQAEARGQARALDRQMQDLTLSVPSSASSAMGGLESAGLEPPATAHPVASPAAGGTAAAALPDGKPAPLGKLPVGASTDEDEWQAAWEDDDSSGDDDDDDEDDEEEEEGGGGGGGDRSGRDGRGGPSGSVGPHHIGTAPLSHPASPSAASATASGTAAAATLRPFRVSMDWGHSSSVKRVGPTTLQQQQQQTVVQQQQQQQQQLGRTPAAAAPAHTHASTRSNTTQVTTNPCVSGASTGVGAACASRQRPEAGGAGAAAARRRNDMQAAGAARANAPPLTALMLLRQNPEAVLVAGPRFPDSDGRIANNANGGPPVNATTAARAAAAVGLTVNAAVSGGIFSSRPRRGDPPAAEGDGRPYTQAGDLAMAVQRHYLTIGGVSQGEAEGVRRQHSRITQRRVARSRTLDQAASPRRAPARPPRSLSG